MPHCMYSIDRPMVSSVVCLCVSVSVLHKHVRTDIEMLFWGRLVWARGTLC